MAVRTRHRLLDRGTRPRLAKAAAAAAADGRNFRRCRRAPPLKWRERVRQAGQANRPDAAKVTVTVLRRAVPPALRTARVPRAAATDKAAATDLEATADLLVRHSI